MKVKTNYKLGKQYKVLKQDIKLHFQFGPIFQKSCIRQRGCHVSMGTTLSCYQRNVYMLYLLKYLVIHMGKNPKKNAFSISQHPIKTKKMMIIKKQAVKWKEKIIVNKKKYLLMIMDRVILFYCFFCIFFVVFFHPDFFSLLCLLIMMYNIYYHLFVL